uniref:Cationic amino acid transporter C-terminal domain-containing protein n=1 Tax=Timema poppense TaxID=170557 RepID=A0A7R9CP75_TIMPO|nr:unnamed protein product [Timema poppensis]
MCVNILSPSEHRYKAELDEEGYSLLLTQMGDIADSSDNSVISTIANLCIVHFLSEIIAGHLVVTVVTSLSFVLLCLILVSITRQPTSSKILSFKVPLVPLLPALSILININLMLMLDIHTWIRFGVWMIVGEFYNVLTMSQDSEHFPIKVLSNHDVRSGQTQETVSEVSGHVSENVRSSKNTNNGVVNETEEDLYPNVIVIPHGDTDEDSQGESCKIEGESEAVYEDENCTAERSDDEQINNNETCLLNYTKDPNKVWRNCETQESELSGERSSQDSFHSAVDVISEQPSEKMVDKLESETNEIDEINNYEEKTLESMNLYDQNENNNGSSTIDNFEVLKKQQIMGGLSSLKFVKKGLSEDESSSGSEDEVFVDTVDPKGKLETR